MAVNLETVHIPLQPDSIRSNFAVLEWISLLSIERALVTTLLDWGSAPTPIGLDATKGLSPCRRRFDSQQRRRRHDAI